MSVFGFVLRMDVLLSYWRLLTATVGLKTTEVSTVCSFIGWVKRISAD